MRRLLMGGLLGASLCQAAPRPSLAAQELQGSYEDAAARALHASAVAYRERYDDSVLQYRAVVQQRLGAQLRTPLKDRTLYRVESAHRVFWTRDGPTVVQMLAHREQTPLGVSDGSGYSGLIDEAFDPFNDRLLFGLVDREEDLGEPDPDDFWFEHPLIGDYAAGYEFATGDTLRLSLPDGRRVLAVELQVVPTVADVRRMTGSLWIEPRSGALVRAVYRLSDTFDALRDIGDLREEEERGEFRMVPSLFKPWTFELSMISVEYALWDFDVWLPRSLRAEGVATAGILKAPAAVDLSYRMESVVTEDDPPAPESSAAEASSFATLQEALSHAAAVGDENGIPYRLDGGWTREWDSRGRRRTVRYLVPRDPAVLKDSDRLPPPVWRDAPGFTSQAELEEMFGTLKDLPTPPSRGVPTTFRWGLQRPDLVRYNRIEALSVGARGQALLSHPFGPVSLTATARLGMGDVEPNGRLDLTWDGLERRITLGAFHELAAIQEGRRHLGIGNSLVALLFGRDDGDYYRRSGAWLEWTPPTAERPTFRVRAYGEYQRPVGVKTAFSLWHAPDDAWSFRPNLVAEEGWEVGGLIVLAPWWGSDPRAVQGGLETTLRAAGGDHEFTRASVAGRLVVPLPRDFRFGMEAGAGNTWGEPPAQRLWYVGGPASLRGYDPLVLGGESFARGRAELARQFSFGALSLFSDVAWAGDRDAASFDDALISAGTGLSILDGLIRVDAAWGLRDPEGFRLEAYLDGIL